MLSSGRTRAVNKKKPVKSKEKAKMLTMSDQVDKSLGEKNVVCFVHWYFELPNQVVSIHSCEKESLLIIYLFCLMQGDDVMLEFDQYVMYHEMKKKTKVSKSSSWAQQFFSEVPA